MLNQRRRTLTTRLTQLGARVVTSLGDTRVTLVVVNTDKLGASAAGKPRRGGGDRPGTTISLRVDCS
jgi:hypothetical protein